LESEGDAVPPEAQSIQFRRDIESVAASTGVVLNGISSVSDSTDADTSPFFVEKAITAGFSDVEEKTLVEFLYKLGSGTSLLRVKDLTLKPYAGQFRLEGRVTIIASYLKNPAKRAPTPAATTSPLVGRPPSSVNGITNKVVPVSHRPITNSTPNKATKPAKKP